MIIVCVCNFFIVVSLSLSLFLIFFSKINFSKINSEEMLLEKNIEVFYKIYLRFMLNFETDNIMNMNARTLCFF